MLLVGGFVLFCILGLAFEGLATVSRDRLGRFSDSGGKQFYQRLIHPYWQLWTILVLITTFGPNLSRSYYDFYWGEINKGLLLIIWFLGFFTLFFSAFITSNYNFPLGPSQRKASTKTISALTMILMIIVFGFLTVPRASQQLEGVLSGPAFAEGTLERKNTDFVSRSGTQYYFEIDGRFYQTPDPQLYNNAIVGEPIHFAFNNSADYWRPEIFDTVKIRLSTTGIITLIASIINWIITSFLVVDGWLSAFNRNRKHFLNA